MNKFEDKFLGWGEPNPLIKVWAHGYFNNDYRQLRKMVENYDPVTYRQFRGELTRFDSDSKFPYTMNNGLSYRHFYMTDKATPRVLPDEELIKLVGTTVWHKDTMTFYRIAKVVKKVGLDMEVHLATLRTGKLSHYVTPFHLLVAYQFEDKSVIGVEPK